VRAILHGRILRRFVLDICACDALWDSAHIIDENIQIIKEKVGTDQVVLGLSGGVDSSVVAALLHKAIGKHPSNGGTIRTCNQLKTFW
jgi:GMP synthase (glutamine-hydrolysing)